MLRISLVGHAQDSQRNMEGLGEETKGSLRYYSLA